MPMNYPNFYPSYYGLTQNQIPQQNQQNQNNSIVWVQGESGAKSYLVAPNTSVLLMDSEQSRFYIKSTDSSGMPSPLRIFEYTEIKDNMKPELQPQAEYITREEFEERLRDLVERPKTRKAGTTDDKSVV